MNHIAVLGSLAVSAALYAKRMGTGARRSRCAGKWPLQTCEMTRQQRRRFERGEVVRRG